MGGRSDPHFNIFHAYRGAAADDMARRRQIEDNLTRALGILLSHLQERGEGLAAPILRELGVATYLHKSKFEVQFQVAAVGASWPPPERRKLIAIVAGGSEPGPELQLGAEGSARPDLVLLWEAVALVVESEVTPAPDAKQMERMRKTFQTSETCEPTTWRKITQAAHRVRVRRTDPITGYLLEQFEEYMALNGFGAFTDEHFAYFALSEAHRKLKPATRMGVQRALDNLMQELKPRWNPAWEVHRGNLHGSDSHIWAKIAPPGRAAPHLSVNVAADGVTVFANIETQEPFRAFRRAWEKNGRRLVDVMATLADDDHGLLQRNPWTFRIIRRLQKAKPNGTPLPLQFWYFPAATLTAHTVKSSPHLLEALVAESIRLVVKGEAAPEITVSRSYQPWEVLEETFLDRLLADAAQLKDFFDWIGEPPKPAKA
jgi:hypothetical protein